MRSSRLLTTAAVPLLLASLVVVATADPLVIDDTEFLDSDWSIVPFPTNGSTHEVERLETGGNPGAYRFMTHSLPKQSSLAVQHTFVAQGYDPSVQGAIGAIGYREDRLQLSPPFQGAAIGALFMIRQGGRVHYSNDITYSTTAWTRRTLPCLHATDFTLSNGQHPDFSAAGEPMSFGYLRSNTNNSQTISLTLQHGIDNFRVVIYPEGDPECDVQPADVRLDKTDGGKRWLATRSISYNVTAANDGDATAAVTLLETVPLGTTFDAAESDPRWSCDPNSSEGSTCSLTTEPLAAGQTESVAFAVSVDESTSVYWSVFNEVAGGGDAASAGAGADATEPATCSLLVPASLCGLFCSAFPAACPAAEDDAALLAGPAVEAESFDRFLLYRIRDRVFHDDAGGKHMTDLFYENGVALALAGMADGDVLELGRTNLRAWEANLRALAAGDGSDAVVASDQIAGLNEFLNALRTAGSVGLRRVIDRERLRLKLDAWIGLSMDEAMERLSNEPCEGYEDSLYCGDPTGDCRVTATDALAALRMAVGARIPNLAADMNGNASIVASDALAVLRLAVGTDAPTQACNG